MRQEGRAFAAIALGLALLSGPAAAQWDIRTTAVSDYVEANVRPWIEDPAIVNAVLAQNAVHAGLDQKEIDALDRRWRDELGKAERPLVDTLLSNPLSLYLKDRQRAAGGLITEIFVMDNRGLNVGQSDVTSDYWQGDEAKWQKSVQTDRIHIDEAGRDESTLLMQSQASLPIHDPRTGAVIGAITIGVNLDAL